MSDTFNAGVALYRMLPTGQAWPKENEDTNLRKLIYGMAHSIDDYINTLKYVVIDQFYPNNSGMFMVDWEELLGLPKCGQTGQSIQDRLAQVLAMFRISPYSNAQFFVDIAAVFGFTIQAFPDYPATITMVGAGTPAVNQTYTYASGAWTGTGGYYILYVTAQKKFKLFDGSFNTLYSVTSNNPYQPPIEGWVVGTGAAPAPTLTPYALTDPFKITIQVDSAEIVYFRAGRSAAGEPLQTTRADAILECILNFFKPAHSYLSFI